MKLGAVGNLIGLDGPFPCTFKTLGDGFRNLANRVADAVDDDEPIDAAEDEPVAVSYTHLCLSDLGATGLMPSMAWAMQNEAPASRSRTSTVQVHPTSVCTLSLIHISSEL